MRAAPADRPARNQALAVPAGRGLLAGAGDPDGDRLRALLHRGPAVGPLMLNGGGRYRNEPPHDFHGLVALLYRVRDSHGGLSAPPGVALLVQPWAGRAVTAPA